MQLSQADLKRATRAHIISDEQADALWSFFEKTRRAPRPLVEMSQWRYWAAGFAGVGAALFLMASAWTDGWGGAVLGAAYASVALWFSKELVDEHKQEGAASLLVLFAIAMVPVSVFGLIQALDYWPAGARARDYYSLIDGRFLSLELSTLLVACGALAYFRMPVLALPVVLTLYATAMDFAPTLSGDAKLHAAHISALFGALVGICGLAVDFRWRRDPDYARWLHVAAAYTVAVGLVLMTQQGELSKSLMGVLGAALACLALVVGKRVYAVVGAQLMAGAALMATQSPLPITVALLAALAVVVSWAWKRQEDLIVDWRMSNIPTVLLRLTGASVQQS